MAHRRRLRRSVAALASVCLATPLALAAATPAIASDARPAGLFGLQDPTYDGVFRQSLALLAYASQDVAPPKAAVDWLLDQQCDDGAFQAFRADVEQPCADADPATYTGPDSNSTALAAQALLAVGSDAAAEGALDALADMQNDDGGVPYISGGSTDANSTALVAMAVSAAGGDPADARAASGTSLLDALDDLQADCSAPADDRGGYAYSSQGSGANDFATVQALLARAGGFLPLLPESAAATGSARLDCGDGGTSDPVEAAAGYLVDRLSDGGVLPDAFGSGTDWGATRFAVIALAAADQGRPALIDAWQALADAQESYLVDDDGADRPGAIAELILATEAAAPSLDAAGIDVSRVDRLTVAGSVDTAELLDRLEATMATPTSASPAPTSEPSGVTTPDDATAGGTRIADTGASTAALGVGGAALVVLGASLVLWGVRRDQEASAA